MGADYTDGYIVQFLRVNQVRSEGTDSALRETEHHQETRAKRPLNIRHSRANEKAQEKAHMQGPLVEVS